MNNAPPNPNNPNQSPVFPPPQRKSPQQVASNIKDYVWAAVTIIISLMVTSIAVGCAYVCVRVVLWACQLVTQALGV